MSGSKQKLDYSANLCHLALLRYIYDIESSLRRRGIWCGNDGEGELHTKADCMQGCEPSQQETERGQCERYAYQGSQNTDES